jgi:hypothetical protein
MKSGRQIMSLYTSWCHSLLTSVIEITDRRSSTRCKISNLIGYCPTVNINTIEKLIQEIYQMRLLTPCTNKKLFSGCSGHPITEILGNGTWVARKSQLLYVLIFVNVMPRV